MIEKPILFSAPMVCALLAGTKTQTRRVLKEAVPPSPAMDAVHPNNPIKHPAPYLDSYCSQRKSASNPRGMSDRWCWWTRDDRQGLPTFGVKWVPGDRLWVRESWSAEHKWTGTKPSEIPNGDDIWYWADGNPENGDWTIPKPSIFMPRWASRITLEVTDVRVERLQDISEADARAEGIVDGGCLTCGMPEPCGCADPIPDARDAYAGLWNHINGPDAWVANPWVVAVSFRRIA